LPQNRRVPAAEYGLRINDSHAARFPKASKIDRRPVNIVDPQGRIDLAGTTLCNAKVLVRQTKSQIFRCDLSRYCVYMSHRFAYCGTFISTPL
jgi:hypothetical protein